MIKNKKSIFFIVSILFSLMLITTVSANENVSVAVGEDTQTLEIASVNQNDEDLSSGDLENIANSSSETKSFDDLQNEVDDLADGDVLSLTHDYKYNGTSNFNGVTINKNNIVIDGNGHTLDANPGDNHVRIFYITGSDVTLKNLVFTNGLADNGGAVYNNGANLKIINSTFMSNAAKGEGSDSSGGAVYNNGANLTISDSTFTNNVVNSNWFRSYGGAVYNKGADFTISDSTFTNNIATNHRAMFILTKQEVYGGAVYNNGANFRVVSSNFTNNLVKDHESIAVNEVLGTSIADTSTDESSMCHGGAIYNSNGGVNFTVIESVFTSNNAKNSDSYSLCSGGAIYNCNGTNFRVINSTFKDNTAKDQTGTFYYYAGGAAIYNEKAQFLVENSSFINNIANYRGGAICTYADNSIIRNSIFINNKANMRCGGAIYNAGANVLIDASSFANNSADMWGGSIYTVNAGVIINNSTFVNSSAGTGGVICNEGDNVLFNSSNFINNTGSNGGAIFNRASNVDVVNSNFVNNKATNGGAIHAYELDVFNSTFINNTATGKGAAINSGGIGCILNLVNNTFLGANTNKAQIHTEDGFISSVIISVLGNNTIDAQYGEDILLFANVTSNGGSVSGKTFCFIINGTQYNATSLDNGSYIANYTLNFTAKQSVSAVYDGAQNPVIKTGAIDARYVSDISINVNNIVFGANATINVNVTSGATGNVTIYVNNKQYTVNLENSMATINVTDLVADTYNVSAIYSGDEYYKVSQTSSVFDVVKANVNNVEITDVVTYYYPESSDETVYLPNLLKSIETDMIYGNGVGITVKVTATEGGLTPTGNITLVGINNGITKQLYNGEARFNIDNLGAGVYKIYAIYAGDNNYNSTNSREVTFTITKATPTINLANVNVISGEDAIITASVTNGVTEVIFTLNNQNITAIVNGTKASATFKNLTAGTYSVVATSIENNNYKSVTTTSTVTVVNPGFADLQSKISTLSDGDTLLLTSDYDYKGVSDSNVITINKNNIVIDGQNHTINAKSLVRIFNITASNVTVKNLILANGKVNGNGSAIYNTGDYLSIINSTFINNTADNNVAVGILKANMYGDTITYGGAVYNAGNSLVVLKSSFINNSAVVGGAIYNVGNNAVVNVSEFVANNAIDGGAIKNNGNDLIVKGSDFANNTATNDGGAISSDGTGFILENNTFKGNNATNGSDIHNVVPVVTLLGGSTINATYGETIRLFATINTNEYSTLYFIINGNIISATLENNIYVANYTVDFVGKKTLSASYSGNVSIVPGFINATKANVNLTSNNIEMLYKDGTRFVAILTDVQGNPLVNQTLTFTINGKTYTRNTTENGTASIALNLVANTYNANVYFNGSGKYYDVSKNITVTINSTINGSDIVKWYQNGTQFFATFVDSQGKVLANTDVKFNINGVFYNRTTDANGTAKLTINLNPGNYCLTAYNLVNGEEKGFNVLVKSVIETGDLTKYYQNASAFEAKIYNKDGSLAINKDVTFNINGVLYTRTTNDKGIASLAINLRPGNYIITTMYDGLAIGNNVTVLSTLKTGDLYMAYQDGSKFQAKTLDSQGNPLSGQNVKFNVNGVFYQRTSGSDGIANLNINLIKGEYIITSMWNEYQIGNTIEVY